MARIRFENAATQEWKSPHFPTVINYVYTSTVETDRGLRDIVTKIAEKNMKEFITRTDFGDILVHTDDFRVDFMNTVHGRLTRVEAYSKYRCEECGVAVGVWLHDKNDGFHCPDCGHLYELEEWERMLMKDDSE